MSPTTVLLGTTLTRTIKPHKRIITIIIIIIIIQCDWKIEARRPDIVFIDKKKREVVMIDVATPGDDRVKENELEKVSS